MKRIRFVAMALLIVLLLPACKAKNANNGEIAAQNAHNTIQGDLNIVQINDGLSFTSACAATAVYDKANGLVFASYLTGNRKSYGEADGKLCLAVFPPAQPQNIRYRTIDLGVGESTGLLCHAHYLIGDGKTRMIFSTTKGEFATFYRDYDFFTDTVSERKEVFVRIGEEKKRLDKASYREVMRAYGLRLDHRLTPLINKVSTHNGEFYTAITGHGEGYPILCKINEDVLEPFAAFPQWTTFEFRYYMNDNGIYAAYRVPPNDTGTGHGGYAESLDGGKTWSTKLYEDGVQSRPDIIDYYGKPLMIYNYKSDISTENFPPMHNSRNAVKIIYDGKVVFDWFSKYGIVEYELVNICGDIYMAFSNCPQALSTENGMAWEEDGKNVEQGKEAIQWVKIGYLANK